MTAVFGTDASGSDQSSNSSRRCLRGESRRTFALSLRSYVRSSSSSAAYASSFQYSSSSTMPK
jgi:hypothetical protein